MVWKYAMRYVFHAYASRLRTFDPFILTCRNLVMVRTPHSLGGKPGGGVTPPHEIGVSDITVVFIKQETSSFWKSSSFILYFTMQKPNYGHTPLRG